VTLFWSFLLILVLVALNGFFVSVEFAAVTSRRARIDLLAEGGNSSAKIVKTWLENPATRDRLIAASQLGITLVSLALVQWVKHIRVTNAFFNNLIAGALQRLVRSWPLPFSLAVIVTSLHVVLGEQVLRLPLCITRAVCSSAASPCSFSVVFKWFIDILDWATRQVLSLIGLGCWEHLTVYTVEEIKHILSESEE
jgi:CBS domain containing-hemolysin-like protein